MLADGVGSVVVNSEVDSVVVVSEVVVSVNTSLETVDGLSVPVVNVVVSAELLVTVLVAGSSVTSVVSNDPTKSPFIDG